MDIDGRHCETEESQRRNANIAGCKKLLARLEEFHGDGFKKREPLIVIEAVEPEPLPPAAPDWIKFIEELPKPVYPSVKRIAHCVCQHFGVSPVDIYSPRRDAKTALARQVAMYLAKTLTPKSYPEIGRRMGGRDHTTVLHGFRKIDRLVAIDAELAGKINELKAQLQ